jgi:hypothetical protein
MLGKPGQMVGGVLDNNAMSTEPTEFYRNLFAGLRNVWDFFDRKTIFAGIPVCHCLHGLVDRTRESLYSLYWSMNISIKQTDCSGNQA